MSWANKYVGIPFADKGRVAEEGLDCYGLVREVFKNERRVDLPSYDDAYLNTEDDKGIDGAIQHEAQRWEEVRGKPTCFDVVVLKVIGLPFHVGVVIDGSKMLHCLKGVGVVVERIDNQRWKDKVAGFYRWKI